MPNDVAKPSVKPTNPNFSSGPCSKRPGYDLNNLDISTLGRSHRSSVGKKALETAVQKTKALLELPDQFGRRAALEQLPNPGLRLHDHRALTYQVPGAQHDHFGNHLYGHVVCA